MAAIVIILAVVAVVAVVAWFALVRRHPENAAAHAGPSGETRYRGITNDRPAGPGAEAEGVRARGVIVPGPMPEADDVDPDRATPPWSSS